MRTQVRISFHNFWAGFGLGDLNRRFPFLLPHYKFVTDGPPDVCFVNFDNRVRKGRVKLKLPRRAIKIAYITENVPPNLHDFDYAISFVRNHPNHHHYRIPNYVCRLYMGGASLKSLVKNPDEAVEPPRLEFCAFVQHNIRARLRINFVKMLSQYKRVDCGGRALNNMPVWGSRGGDRWQSCKLQRFRKYKFVVAFENTTTRGSEGYVTEKITDAMMAGCIPIYCGDSRVGEDFN